MLHYPAQTVQLLTSSCFFDVQEELEGMTEEQLQAHIQELEAASSTVTATNEEQVQQLMAAAEPSVTSGSVDGPARPASYGKSCTRALASIVAILGHAAAGCPGGNI